MIPKELAKKIRVLQITTNKVVNDILAGEYKSVFKGRGMEFEEVREYSPGDDIRTIDWNVTARTGKPYVKRYVEERELTIMFIVDMSASGEFGSVNKLKNEMAAELCALLSFSAVKNNDKVGLILFTDRVEKFIPPKKGTTHVLRVIRELLSFRPRKTNTDIAGALDYFGRIASKSAVVFLVSDFLAEDFEKPMSILGKKHDLIAATIVDPSEKSLPDVGLLELEDAETGETVIIDTGSSMVRKNYRRLGEEQSRRFRNLFSSMGVDHIEIRTDRDYVPELVKFFRIRERRY
ncbi:MAG: DUF58 domain-containing protein [Candidatus Latescibacteria bacterium]|nr:DUF58 domain-containing protein [bacterium]MBD3424751.1 DUF58 domain-containing protein [Candidatus Latescibacterota bacterium]